ncbi:MAG: DUF2177 family protein [Tissierellia bacterium]|jgi:uncharacterized membrane protein|nr:DUF2177 family protein [Tissierellia bacterium]
MWEFMKTYLVAFGVFAAVEGTWLTLIAKDFYQKQIGYIMSSSPKIVPTVFFALIFIVGLVFFVISPALAKDSWKYAVLVGLLFGLVSYSTYDLTNLATLEGWPSIVSIVDLIWGATMSALVSTISFFILKR